MAATYQLGWFSTGRDKAARDLLEAVYSSIKLGEIKAKIAFFFCNREPGESRKTDLFLKLVESYQIPLVYFSYQRFKAAKGAPNINEKGILPLWRLEYDREVTTSLSYLIRIKGRIPFSFIFGAPFAALTRGKEN